MPGAKACKSPSVNGLVPKKRMMVPGNMMSEVENITGITPAVFTLSGIWVACPPITRLPTTRLAYCTGSLRCAC